ncbi:MAG: fatty acid desaturase, partial [Mesorhizobium sp.]
MDHRDVIASLTQQQRDRLTAKSDHLGLLQL